MVKVPPPPFRVRLRRRLLKLLPRTWALRIELRDTGRQWAKAMAEARARKATTEELEEVNSGWVFDYRMDEDQLETIYTDRLVSKANRLRVPVPAKPWDTEDHEDENWMESQYGGWILKPEGFRKVRAEIRAELKARSERRQAWLTPLTGLIGALTGLVATLRGCGHP